MIKTDTIHLDTEIVEIANDSLKNGTAWGEGEVQTEVIKSGTAKLFASWRGLIERFLNEKKCQKSGKLGWYLSFTKREEIMNAKIIEESQ